MILRWTAAALLAAEKNFRRVKGCRTAKPIGKGLAGTGNIPKPRSCLNEI